MSTPRVDIEADVTVQSVLSPAVKQRWKGALVGFASHSSNAAAVHHSGLASSKSGSFILQVSRSPALSRGFIKELTITVPWKNLRSKSLEVRFDAVEVLPEKLAFTVMMKSLIF